MRIPNVENDDVKALLGPINGQTVNVTDPNTLYNEVPWFRIKDVRVTGRNTNIAVNQLVNEPVNFKGLMATPIDALEDGSVDELFSYDPSVAPQ